MLHELTHVENTSTWVNSSSAFFGEWSILNGRRETLLWLIGPSLLSQNPTAHHLFCYSFHINIAASTIFSHSFLPILFNNASLFLLRICSPDIILHRICFYFLVFFDILYLLIIFQDLASLNLKFVNSYIHLTSS